MLSTPAARGRVAARATPATAPREVQRRLVVNLIFLIYLLALIEGPLRKWFLPGVATPLYFLRDPVVIGLYIYAFRAGFLRFEGWLAAWLTFAAVASLLGAIPFAIEQVDLRAWFFGVRTYWLYLPLAFLIGAVFDRADFRRFIMLNLLIAVPYAALVVLQYRSPPGAWINSSISGDEGIVTVALGIVRPYGLFTFTGQNVIFSASLVSFLVASMYLFRRGGIGWRLVLLAALCVAALSVLTGSRSIYFMVGAIFAATLVGLLFSGRGSKTAGGTIMIFVCVSLAAFLFVNVFSDAYEAMQIRFERAEQSEGAVEKRALRSITGFVPALATAPVIGHGIGLGTPALNRFLNRPQLEFGEGDLMRNVNELGIVNGLVMVALRFAFAGYLLLVAFRAARNGHPEYLPLAGFAALGIAQAQITHSTLNGFQFWLVAGLVLSAMRLPLGDDRRRGAQGSAPPARRAATRAAWPARPSPIGPANRRVLRPPATRALRR
jgi:hypothetical protein